MRRYPEDDLDRKEMAELNAEPWMVEQLRLNPEYCSWGPYEDYMAGAKGHTGWDQPVFLETWADFKFGLDELNEVVNFYFDVRRASENCEACDCTGYNPETKRIADDFYALHLPNGSLRDQTRWDNKITQDEVDALIAGGRLTLDFKDGHPTAEQVNAWQSGRGMGHDAINRWILVETRAKRLGVWGKCNWCAGHGYVFTEPSAKLGLVLWVLHPRKGCSRGVEIKNIQRDELPAVYAYLRDAAQRNAQRFGKIPNGEVAHA